MTTLPPIRRQVLVEAGPQLAFEVFTEEIRSWWPVADGFSVFGAGSDVAFRDGRLVEAGMSGGEAVWGTVLDWGPPRRLRITWHPGADPDKASEVEVSFWPVAEARTIVTVEHRGWERLPDPADARREYGHGWPEVHDRYRGRVPAPAAIADGGTVWLALSHTPGPAALALSHPPGSAGPSLAHPPGRAVEHPIDVFAHPDFGEHVAFLRRLADRGVLVGAGPFPASGEGMAILRLPSADQAGEYLRLAYEDDQSVVRGLFEVCVRPWSVRFTST